MDEGRGEGSTHSALTGLLVEMVELTIGSNNTRVGLSFA